MANINKLFHKYLVRIFISMMGEGDLYKNVVSEKNLFPNTTDPKDIINTLKFAKKYVPYYEIHLPSLKNLNQKNILKEYKNFDFNIDKSLLKKNILGFMDQRLLRKRNIISKDNFLITKGLKLLRKTPLIPANTAGSTGKPMQFYKSKKNGLNMLLQLLAAAKHHGWEEGEPVLSCWQRGTYFQIDFVETGANFLGFPFFIFDAMGDSTSKQMMKLLKTKKPTVIVGFPSYLSAFSTYIIDHKIELKTYPKCIITIGEMLLEHQRELIEKVFKTKVYSIYGTNELGFLALECKEQNGLHIFEDKVFLENNKDKNIIVTTLEQKDMPLIKYNVQDKGEIKHIKCKCGITGKKIAHLEGRVEEFVFNKKNEKVYASYLRQLILETNDKFHKCLYQIKFIQRKNKDLDFYLQVTNQIQGKKALDHLTQTLKKDLNLKVTGKIIKDLTQEKGKFRYLTRES